jgi:hypothetical protein
MSHICTDIFVYGVPVSDAEIYDWNQKHDKEFLDEKIDIRSHGCEYIIHGDMNVEVHVAIGISVSKREVYASGIEEIDPVSILYNWEQREGWNTNLTRALLNLELDYKKPSWMLLYFFG